MKKTKDLTIQVPSSIQCDVCDREYDCETDCQEAQEFVSVEFVGGYNSVFGDGNRVTLDICQRCFKDRLGTYVKVHPHLYGDKIISPVVDEQSDNR